MDASQKSQLSKLQRQLTGGQISRRDFLRAAALFGLSLGAADALASCSPQPTATPYPTPYEVVKDIPEVVAAGKKMIVPGGEQAGTQAAGLPVEPGSIPPTVTPVQPNKKITWMCNSCGERLPNADALKKHAMNIHARRLPPLQHVELPTYAPYLVGKVERFDERNTVFNRSLWDKKYQTEMKAASSRARPEKPQDLEGRALVAGAIFVDDTAGSLHPAYYGYNGYVRQAGGLYAWEEKTGPVKYPVPDPLAMTERIKDVARFYGADLVGIAALNQNWVYSHYFENSTGEYGPLSISLRFAIVLGIEMSWKEINTTPGWGASAATALAYSRMAELSASLAKYIRTLGYPALPCGNDTAESIPLAIDAGLGELGRNGLLLTPEYGPRQRLCKVLTDLPLVPDQPVDFGAASYCETCFACAKSCPAKAIRREERTTEVTSISNRPGLLRWPVHVSNCYLFWLENGGVDCSNCVAACPWALPGPRDWLEL